MPVVEQPDAAVLPEIALTAELCREWKASAKFGREDSSFELCNSWDAIGDSLGCLKNKNYDFVEKKYKGSFSKKS